MSKVEIANLFEPGSIKIEDSPDLLNMTVLLLMYN